MKRITFSLDDENYKYLKNNKRGSSLSFTLNELLTAIREAGVKVKPTISSDNLINTTNLPANTTIRTTTATPATATPETTLTPYRKLQTRAKELLGRYLLYDEWCLLDFRNFDHEYYDKKYETPTEEGAAVKCTYIYNLPEERQEQYLKDIKQYDSHHPFNPHDYDEYDYEPKTWADRIVFPHD